MIEIQRAESPAHFRDVNELMAEYVAWDIEQRRALGQDVDSFLEFYYGADEETLPGPFVPPDGLLLLARESGRAAGCGGFRRLSPDACEAKRMYVRPDFRGRKLGREIAVHLIRDSRAAGYRVMKLQTTTFMASAVALYRSLGFCDCEPYYIIPDAFRGVSLFMELSLR